MSLECIQDNDSINFDTSIGAWSGPLTWAIPAWSPEGGAGIIALPAYGQIVTISLAYAAIITLKPGTFYAVIGVAFDPPATQISMKVKAGDGVHNYEGTWYTSYQAQHWESPAVAGNIPNNWNIEGVFMEVLLAGAGIYPTVGYVDGAHFVEEYTPTPPQTYNPSHLPIIGVG